LLSRFRLIPQDERFFDWFERIAQNNLEAGRLLLDLLQHYDDVERKARHLKDIEHRGDELTHQIFAALNRTFVTPFDREDIASLASALDDVIDWIEESARRVQLYRLPEMTPISIRFGRIIVEQCEQITLALPLLESGRNGEQLERATEEIHRLENEADDVLAEAVATLYDGVTEVPPLIQAIRWGDIYQLLEDATDKCEDVATVIRNIAGKKS
jgi:uncharacterized protein Yka (UPF0111/DUF47 family)